MQLTISNDFLVEKQNNIFGQDGKESALQGGFSRRIQEHLEFPDDHTRGKRL